MDAKTKFLIDVMSRKQKWQFRGLVLLWIVTLVWFWSWWLQSNHVVTIVGLLVTSYVAVFQTVVPIWFFWFADRAKKPNMSLPIPTGRVAMMTTKVPSEPNEMIYRTLTAMLKQTYPYQYDVWLAAEESKKDNPALYMWCENHGVGVTCRKGIPEFNRKTYPGQAKTKEGNTLSWYVMVGYDKYDFVVQMDSDHAPGNSNYLRHMIVPFNDPKVGLVAAPSVCDANKNESWAVRGRLYAEATVHGFLQAGYGTYGSAMGIGSHYAVRTKALKEGGGPGPTRAEDASTTMFVDAAGYDSVFSMDAEAHGDGPDSFSALITQEVDWSSSLMRILLEWTPKYLHKLPLRKRIVFLFAQGWYSSYASYLLVGSLLPVIALLTGVPWMNMNYLEFIWRWWVLVAFCILPIWFIKSKGWLRPQDAPLISWEAIFFQTVRWPWAVVGCIQGAFAAILRTNYTFHLTPKGKNKERPLDFGSILPYLVIIIASGLAIITIGSAGKAEGYRFLALLDVLLYSIALGVIVFQHFKETVGDLRSQLSGVPGVLGNIVSVLIIVAAANSVLPKLTPVFAAAQITQQDSAFQYVGLRTQLGPMPTPQPTANVIQKLILEIPTVIPLFPKPTPLSVIDLPTEKMLTGMYDPSMTFADVHWDIKHSFVDWNDPKYLDAAITSAQKVGQFPMMTVEPLPKTKLNPTTLLQDIAAGKYDDTIKAMAATISRHAPQQVIIRWGHEMELCGAYVWATCKPGDYILAWQHVVDLVRSEGVTNTIWMWSPAGNNNTQDYYPGGEYVDMIGLTVLVSEDWDRLYGNDKPWPEPMAQVFYIRYERVSGYKKPVMIAELGVSYSDPVVDRTPWLTAGFKSVNQEKYPLYVGWVFFNEQNQANKHVAILPDFRVTRDELLNALDLSGGR